MLVKKVTRRFLEWISEHRAENTYKFYDGRLAPFVRRFGDLECSKLKKSHIEKYFKSVNYWQAGDKAGKPMAPDTQRSNIVAFEQWQKFAIKLKAITEPIIEDIEKPVGRMRERLPTAAEVELIKAKCSPEFLLVYQALRQSGARPNELARATVADWNKTDGMIVLEKHKTARKTGRPRKIAVGQSLLALITQSLGERTDGPLFLSPQGRQWTTESLSATFRRNRNAAGVTSEVVLYTARHEHATEICRTLSIEDAADLLGHTSTNTTRRYRHKTPAELRDNQDAFKL